MEISCAVTSAPSRHANGLSACSDSTHNLKSAVLERQAMQSALIPPCITFRRHIIVRTRDRWLVGNGKEKGRVETRHPLCARQILRARNDRKFTDSTTSTSRPREGMPVELEEVGRCPGQGHSQRPGDFSVLEAFGGGGPPPRRGRPRCWRCRTTTSRSIGARGR